LAALFGKAGNGLVAVMPRLRHAAHRFHRRKAAQQRLQFGLFLRQLLRIRGGQQRAAAAMAGKVGAGGVHAFPSRGWLPGLARCVTIPVEHGPSGGAYPVLTTKRRRPSMNVLLINGSPHKTGCTYTALTEV